MLTQKRRAIPVDFASNFHDRKVREMKRQGFTYEAIAHHTGLSPSQVGYRVHKGGLSRSLAYRRGQDEKSRTIIHRIDNNLAKIKGLRKFAADVLAGKRPDRRLLRM